jgi:hypothetical protein
MNYLDFKQAIEQYYFLLQERIDILSERLEAPHALESKIFSLDRDEDTFQVMLLNLIDQQKLSDADVYKKANVSRQHFSKIRSDLFYLPKKETVMKFIIALKLNHTDAKNLLNAAGYAFATSFWLDVVILYCIENREFDAIKIDQFLIEKGQPPLFSDSD